MDPEATLRSLVPAVEGLSRELSDPIVVERRRAEAIQRASELPIEPDPLYRKYGYFGGVELGAIDPQRRGVAVRAPPLGSRTLQFVHDASGTRVRRSDDLKDERIVWAPLDRIWTGPKEELERFLGTALPYPDRLSALAFATLNRGYKVTIPESVKDSVRLQDVTVLSEPDQALSVRRLIEVGRGSSVLVTEELYATSPPSSTPRWYASATEVRLGPQARSAILTVHAPDRSAVSYYDRRGALYDGSQLDWMWNGLGGFRTKVRNTTDLVGTGSRAGDLQTFYGDKEQSYDSGIRMNHRGTGTHGQSITRGVFQETARGMSRGLVRIEPEARGTLSYLSEHAMLLSRGARSDTIPILEILCRDVKATHSSSVAPVDPEKVFYLEARGVPRSEAVRMIGEGFLSHVLERSPVHGLRDLLYPHLATRWEGGELPWNDGETLPSLPHLEPSAGEGASDWRFDAKLR